MALTINDALGLAVRTINDDFGMQLVERPARNGGDKAVRPSPAFGTSGYALVDRDGRLVEIEPLRQSVQACERMKDVAWRDWGWFAAPGPRASLKRQTTLLRSFVEGYRLRDRPFAAPPFDYWRLYENGLAATAATYVEDAPSEFLSALHGGTVTIVPRFLDTTHTIWRLHSLLAHARFVGEQVAGVERVLVRLDWRGLDERCLLYRGSNLAGPPPHGLLLAPDVDIRWTDLRDHYADQVALVANQVFGRFEQPSGAHDFDLADANFVRDELAQFGLSTVRLL